MIKGNEIKTDKAKHLRKPYETPDAQLLLVECPVGILAASVLTEKIETNSIEIEEYEEETGDFLELGF